MIELYNSLLVLHCTGYTLYYGPVLKYDLYCVAIYLHRSILFTHRCLAMSTFSAASLMNPLACSDHTAGTVTTQRICVVSVMLLSCVLRKCSLNAWMNFAMICK